MQTTLDKPEVTWQEIRAQLKEEKARIFAEIGRYPAPITACDQQFNYLLEQQAKIVGELARLTEAETASLTADNPQRLIDDFVQSSAFPDLIPR